MGMVAPKERIASAYFVICGAYGSVSRYAQERGVCRQWVYREAAWVQKRLNQQQKALEDLRQQVRELRQSLAERDQRLTQVVVLDKAKQEEFACVCQALGVTLSACHDLLEVLLPGQQPSVPTLGRVTKAAGQKAGQLLAVFDEWARERVRDAAADEIYVKDPVLMIVEQESLCWLTGRLSETVTGEGWAAEFRHLPNLDQMARDGGSALQHGVALINAERQARGQPAVVDQGDHFHALRSGGVGLRKDGQQASQALAAAEVAEQKLTACRRQGTSERL
jgi:cell division septum initiation protein DivIVA